MGAAILAAKACLRTGVGLLTAHIPADGNCIMQSALPEAMVNVDKASGEVSELPEMTNYSAIGAGPGLGMGKGAQTLIQQLLSMADNKPLVLDADALNIISENKELLDKIPPMTILTPHPKEFDRLAGDSENGYDRHLAAINFAKKYSVIVVLKGAYTMVATPEGSCWFNSSGNSGMATGGSGDVLTGMILSLLAQGYEPVKAAVAGVYLHGSAGDYAALKRSQEGLIAGDIVEGIGKAFLGLRNS
jgi:NAD(P)H-hydrate epimerase